ncbi:NAD(P)-dependent alcohol dehydrogenase [uncultured Jatrophihabitans sp.]|uniref:NAD(P)-dependent alcohol dehydrogenase n=1 Tax=uncultured Jatrophihabitans sp. TaxID=1610747 RepID=UPI0035C94AEC
MTSAIAYATPSAKAPFEKTTIERRELGPKDVLIKIAFAGICHSDIHTGRNEWGEAHFPLVPGHEIAGVVEEVGGDVSKFAVGDRAGVGCMVDSCRECENCLAGEEQYCLRGNVGTYNAKGKDGRWTDGGYSSHIVVDEDFVLHIPDGIELDVAAPLLCAGITLYSPLKHWQAGPGKKVAIIGLGGLGHMGVKIAHAMGAEVSVLSQTLGKKADGEKFGADHYYATSDDATFKELKGEFDLIVNTVSASLPMAKYLSLLRRDGTLVSVGAPAEPLEVPAFALIMGRRSWAGSAIGGIRETQEMLDFCAEHGIGAEIEKIGADQIDEAWDRVVDSDVRYRFVIDTATFAS